MGEAFETDCHSTSGRLRCAAGVVADDLRDGGAQLQVAVYVGLIVLCVLFAPQAPLQFIYTEL